VLKRELLKLLEEDQELREAVRARLGIGELVSSLQALSTSLEKLAESVKAQSSSAAEAAARCEALLRALAQAVEEQNALLREIAKAAAAGSAGAQATAKEAEELKRVLGDQTTAILEELKKQGELLKKVLLGLQLR
jgi:methyl-accepting chemotaxis protein